MSEPGSSLSNDTRTASASSRVIHDLRAPLIVALGYLDELRIVKSEMLAELSSSGDGAAGNLQIAKDAAAEMGLCLDAIRDSLNDLDSMMVELRGKL